MVWLIFATVAYFGIYPGVGHCRVTTGAIMSRKQKKQPSNQTQKPITASPRTPNQHDYIKAIRTSFITFCTGHPGTGKTFLAVAEAIRAIQTQEIKKIIISRPIIGAGESLGYLPGGIDGKVKPYLMPVFDALKEFLSYEKIAQLKNQGKLEINPLAYMRGRTFKDAFVILDEAQNATLSQLKMLLTRLGSNSKIIICGDVKQSDIHVDDLSTCARALKDIKGISHIELASSDIVRHSLIGIITERLEAATKPNGYKGNGNGHSHSNRITQKV